MAPWPEMTPEGAIRIARSPSSIVLAGGAAGLGVRGGRIQR